MRIYQRLIIIFGLFFSHFRLTAQIIPPGLSSTNTAIWTAIGIEQDLETKKNLGWSSASYLGIGRMSHPDNYNFFQKPSIFIINQEFKNKFSRNLEYSLAASYRAQNNYSKFSPYASIDPILKHEVRIYGRFSNTIKIQTLEITPTIRQEIQKYFSNHSDLLSEHWRLRSRFRLKVKFPLSNNGVHKLSLYSEQLFSNSFNQNVNTWTRFAYKDSRFSIYYTLDRLESPLKFNVGYMNNLIGEKAPISSHHLGVDIIWKNPF